jgi:cell division protein FtsB
MKRLFLILLLLATLFSVTACSSESQYERNSRLAQQRVQNAQNAYDRAVQEYNDLADSISRYNAAADALG